MRPVPDSKSTSPSLGHRAGADPVVAPEGTTVARPDDAVPGGRRPLKPIGAEALKALREAIRSGKYPSDAAVVRGLERMMRTPRPAPDPDGKEPS